VRAVVLWAEGRLFTAGLDLKEAATGVLAGAGGGGRSLSARNYELYRTIKELQECFTAVAQCRKPVIAAIHNKCIGGGVDLVTACDIRLCSADASFSIYETKIAIVADVGTLQRITPIVGKGMAREMAMTGRFIPAERALACGLVNEIHADKEALLAAARAMAGEIAANSPLAVQGVKAVLDFSDEHSTAEGLEYVAQWNSSFIQSNDVAEAVSAFIEKRPPVFKGD
jgi:enoyl-CoA hydratase